VHSPYRRTQRSWKRLSKRGEHLAHETGDLGRRKRSTVWPSGHRPTHGAGGVGRPRAVARPILVGSPAARRLGSNPIVVAIVGGVLCYPSIVALSNPDHIVKVTQDDGSVQYTETYHVIAQFGQTVFNADFFGIPVTLPQGNAYASSIFPIIVGAWLAAKIEPWLKKVLPAVIRPIFGPLIEIFVVSALILLVFGPAVMFVSGGIASLINAILDFNYPIAGLVIGGFYQCLVIFGLHWAVIPLISSELASTGNSYLNAIVSATMIAQGGGALAVWIKIKKARIKSMAGPATVSAFCGITEPAMYGLNLKYGRIFITASLGGAVGGLLTGLCNHRLGRGKGWRGLNLLHTGIHIIRSSGGIISWCLSESDCGVHRLRGVH